MRKLIKSSAILPCLGLVAAVLGASNNQVLAQELPHIEHNATNIGWF